MVDEEGLAAWVSVLRTTLIAKPIKLPIGISRSLSGRLRKEFFNMAFPKRRGQSVARLFIPATTMSWTAIEQGSDWGSQVKIIT